MKVKRGGAPAAVKASVAVDEMSSEAFYAHVLRHLCGHLGRVRTCRLARCRRHRACLGVGVPCASGLSPPPP